MTDKVQKIREDVEKRYEYWKEKESNSHSIESEIRMSECQHLLLMLNLLQEDTVDYDKLNTMLDDALSKETKESWNERLDKKEPVSKFPNTESMIESYKQRLISQANGVKDSPLIDMCLASYKHGINETLDTLNLSNVQRTVKNWKEPVSEEWIEELTTKLDSMSKEDFKKVFDKYAVDFNEEPVSEDLEKIVEEIAEPTILNAYGTKELARRLRNTVIYGTSVSEDLEEASKEWLAPQLDKSYANYGETKMMELTHFDGYAMLDAIEFGVQWKEQQFEKDYIDLCNGIATAKGIAVAMAYDKGMADAREQMMAKAIDVEVKVDAGEYPYISQMELYDYDKDVPLAKEGDKYKVVLIKEE